MAYAVEVKFFNSFVLKKVVDNDKDNTWPSLITATLNNNTIWPVFPLSAYVDADQDTFNWAIEESRQRGGYNNTDVGYGVKAYAVEPETNASLRVNSLIYSGIFNSRTGVNNTNVFSVAEEITKSADPANGSIQKLYAEDTNLIIFQENKVSRALIDKDAIYTAEGGGAVTNVNTTIGTIQPYTGEYGISRNPESFAVYGYRKYFTDSARNAVMRLSMDGLEEISKFGMVDYFRDNLGTISVNNGKAIGAYDVHSKQYVLSLQAGDGRTTLLNETLVFDEGVKGWTSYMSYIPNFMFSLKNKFYSVKKDEVYKHYDESVDSGEFYGERTPASIKFIVNAKPSLSKLFKTINYEGDSGWFVKEIITSEFDVSLPILSYIEGTYDSAVPPNTGFAAITHGSVAPIRYAGFTKKEGKYKAVIKNNTSAQQGEIISGASMSGVKGYFATVTMQVDNITSKGSPKELFAVSTDYVESSY